MKDRIAKLCAKVISSASAVGGTEKDGPLGKEFDIFDENDRFSMDTWEKSESKMQRIALQSALEKGKIKGEQIQAIFAGDLLNQCVGSAYGMISFDSPYFGLYGACSTCAQGILLASMGISGGFFDTAAAVTSSHNCTAERQYRTPIEYGGQKPPTAQWTVTGAGAFVMGKNCSDGRRNMAEIVQGLPGIVIDSGISDVNNMGAAMAPAAADTLKRYFRLSHTNPLDFDMILTGDLGEFGSKLLRDLLLLEGYDIDKNRYDCGCMIYDTQKNIRKKMRKSHKENEPAIYPYVDLSENLADKQKKNTALSKEEKKQNHDVNCGGSGCGCSASVLASHILPKLEKKELSRVLFVATGAMMSPSSIQQGLTIPGIAHLLLFESPKNI